MDNNNVILIKPRTKLFDINLKEVFEYRDLIYLFVKRNYSTRYKQTILGPAWLVINPLFTVVLYSFLFGVVANLQTDGVPQVLFYLVGNAIWSLFANSLNSTSVTFAENAGVFGKVYFPRLVAPISTIITCILDSCIQIAMIAIALLFNYLYYGISYPTHYIWLFPIVMLQTTLMGMGIGLMVSSLTTKYRDLKVLIGFGVQLWMYATPVVYSLSQVPEQFLGVYMYNPMAPVLLIWRYAWLGAGSLPFAYWGYSWLFTLLMLVLGVVLFNKTEKNFMDTL
ncbi:MAG: ABC transporter permease [Cellulosilyticum sp.]|nr:ABC transporter permease [Cellulosilyticum sp.]